MCALEPEQWLRGRLHRPPRTVDAFEKIAARVGAGLPRRLLRRLVAGQPAQIRDVLSFSHTERVSLYHAFLLAGHDLEDLPLLQAALHRNRTLILPATVYDHERLIDWPTPLGADNAPHRGEFLSELTATFDRHPVSVADATSAPHYLYVRTGRDDTNLAPVLVPGTVVRVDTTDRGPGPSGPSRPIYAVADRRGITCTYVDWLADRTIALVPHRHDARPVVRRLEDEAVVLGRVCAELRPMCINTPSVSVDSHDHRSDRLVRPDPEQQTFGRFLRSARQATGMTHRQAHEITATIAREYDDPRFAIGLGTLSDWESQDDLPLHVAHVFSLAACYAVSFGDLLRAGRAVSTDPFPIRSAASLVHAVRIVAALPNVTWDDVFRCGNRDAVFDHSLAAARFLIVNRGDRRIANTSSTVTVDRPLYVLADSNGRHVCSGCFVDGRYIYLQPDPQLPLKVRALPRARVMVRGRVVAAYREIERLRQSVRTAAVVPRP